MVLQVKANIFEKHPKKTGFILFLLILLALYGAASIKFINNKYTEFENKSIKKIVHQYYVGQIIDNNIGRFIKLREHRPDEEKFERPTRNYVNNLEPNALERKYYRVVTDKHGFIGPSEIHENPDYKIVFLGGSTTECLYMDEHDRFPYKVGRLLEQSLGKKVNSYNGGVSANESLHSINILLNKVIPMQPQVVVFMHNINDLVILRSQGSYWYPNSLKSHVQSAKNIFTRYEFPENSPGFDEQKISEEFARNLRTFIAICKIRNITPVLMTQANRVKDDPLYHRFNDIIREVGLKESVKVIDLANNIEGNSENFYDSYHYTAKGADFAAKIIAKELQPLLKQ
ncbi:MAG: SGNH/GDSL hydrolase family protein [Proteobacteria bacterium]|nr:SGNH/GDSL hydrolase family protein [Pseudomonadota bacterium]